MKHFLYMFIILGMLSAQQRVYKVEHLQNGPQLDGYEDEIWHRVKSESNFLQEEPKPLEKPTRETEFKVSYDKENIYFFIKVFDHSKDIIAKKGKRDNAFWGGDWILIYVDPMGDKKTGYRFGVNPYNVQHDARLFNDNWNDDRWDAIWFSETAITDEYWTAEIRIPLRCMKFNDAIHEWGFNLERNIYRLRENSYWEPVDPQIGFKVSKMGTLNGLKNLESRNDINIEPSLVSNFDSDYHYDPSKFNRYFGMDLRYNFDAQHSILATIRPDFAQIESDDEQFNLSDYPLFLMEKRPFFIEGSDLFNMPDNLFYSRRFTRPDLGLKFFGSQAQFKYGLLYTKNIALETDINNNPVDVDEHIFVPRIQFFANKSLNINYFSGILFQNYTDKKVFRFDLDTMQRNKQRHIHALDLIWNLTENLRLTGMFAKSFSNGLKSNHTILSTLNYESDTWRGNYWFQKSSPFFDQSIVGYAKPNNKSMSSFWMQRRIRLGEKLFRDLRININHSLNGTYANQNQNNYANINANVNMQDNALGNMWFGIGIWQNRGYFRNYDETTHSDLFDNYGYFTSGKNDVDGYWLSGGSDWSKEVAVSFNYSKDGYKQSDIHYYFINLGFRPNDAINLSLSMDYSDIKGSALLNPSQNKIIKLRGNFALNNEINIKVLSQIVADNSQSSTYFANNIIIAYEYLRGSYIYMAYTETGDFDRIDPETQRPFNRGTLFPNYDLQRRTFSLKWTYNFYL